MSDPSGRYTVQRVRAGERGAEPLLAELRSGVVLRLAGAGGHCWGAFSGLFGLGSNELMVVSWLPENAPALTLWDSGTGTTVVEEHRLVPPLRPVTPDPMTRAGLYVFRFFTVAPEDVEEIVRLSGEAWTTFEGGGDYRAEPQALFAEAPGVSAAGVMLLVTWYDGFASWETSRTPPPEARANFRRRHELTGGTTAIATRLIPEVG